MVRSGHDASLSSRLGVGRGCWEGAVEEAARRLCANRYEGDKGGCGRGRGRARQLSHIYLMSVTHQPTEEKLTSIGFLKSRHSNI
jgi:hypothetical protein